MKKIFLQITGCIIFYFSLGINVAFSQASEKIHHFEYFFDTDPGFGNATQVTVPTPAVTVTNLNFAPNISVLSSGLHTLNVRAVDSLYRRSITKTQLFYKETLLSNPVANITKAEYFFDTDPGFGNATVATVTAGQTVTFSFGGDISALTNGLHNLFVRTQDANGNWSKSVPQLFYKEALTVSAIPNITSAEYFFDTDPGFGNATAATVSAGQIVTFNFAANIALLSNGLHNLIVRTSDANGKWSISTKQLFYKEAIATNAIPNITSAEYFFDTDPGFGNATGASITAGQIVTFNFNGNITSLSNGFHNLFVRTRDANGKWSLSTPQIFYKQPAVNNVIPNVTSAEYFFDTDPGFGNATVAAVTAGQMVTINFAANITALTNGLHNLFVRTKDANGSWSLSVPQLFYKEAVLNNPVPNITSAEYFFDTDPGFGNATTAAVIAGQTITFNFAGNISTLTNGLHNLFVRTRDVNGKWSLSVPQLFYKEAVLNNPVPNITSAEYFFDTDPGFGNATTATVTAGQNVNFNFNAGITSLTNGLHYLYVRTRDINGKWSLSIPQLFYKEPVINNPIPNIIAAEYYIDSDPGFGSGTAFTVSPQGQTIIQNFNFAASSLTRGLHRLYIRVKDASGKWSLTNTPLFYYETVLPVPPTDQFVKLEWFWTTDPGFGNATAVSIPPGNNGQITNFAFNVPVNNSFSGTKKNLYIRVLDDWSLTTVRVVDFTGVVLPVTLLEFTAQAQQNIVMAKWSTTQELNSDYFEVEHSIDGINFKKFGKINAAGNSNTLSEYSLPHNEPVIGANYYRLKQFDKNGHFEYSPVVKILFNGIKGTIVAYPNPVSDKLNITVPQSLQNDKAVLQLFDTKGALVLQKAITEKRTEIMMVAFAAGNYSLIIRDKNNEVVDKKIIVKQ